MSRRLGGRRLARHRQGGRNDPGDDDHRGPRPLREDLRTAGAEKRKLHGSKGSTVFLDPNEENRVWALFDWDLDGWKNFASDPEVPAIMQEAGHKSRPQVTELVGRFDA
jgi:hypothetical protein